MISFQNEKSGHFNWTLKTYQKINFKSQQMPLFMIVKMLDLL